MSVKISHLSLRKTIWKKNISRREFLERMGVLGGLGAAYCGMARYGLLPFAHAHTGPPRPDHSSGEGQHIVILGAGVAGLCAAYLMGDTQFKITIFSISTILTAPENLSSDSVGLKGGGNRNIRKEHRSIHKLNYLNFNLFGIYFYRTFKGPCHI